MELEDLRQKLLVMAGRAEAAVSDSVLALVQRNRDLAFKVCANDDVIDRLEVEIDEMAIKLLTKAPLASDLRLVAVVMKVSQNLERIADEATKIAKRANDLLREPPIKMAIDLPRMATLTLGMVKDALDAFIQKNSAAARTLIPRDKEVDALNRQLQAAVARHMMDEPSAIMRGLHWIVAIKSLERIADHAKNISEETVFLCEAEDIRHRTAMV